MTHGWAAGWIASGEEAGLAKARELAIVDLLSARGIDLSEELRDQIAACAEPRTALRQAHSPWAKQWKAAGEARTFAKGLATALLNLLWARNIEVPGMLSSAIADCTDAVRLRQLFRCAVTASSVDDLYDCLKHPPDAAQLAIELVRPLERTTD